MYKCFELEDSRNQMHTDASKSLKMNFSGVDKSLEYYSSYDDQVIAEKDFQDVTVQKLIETVLILMLCATTTISNLLAIFSMLSIRKNEVLDFYILSISVANLLVSTLVIPFSFASRSNMFGCFGYIFCSVSGYLHVSLAAVCMYNFMWMSVDRYLVVRKPLRYDVIQTRTRCKCWILFTWVMATCLCCPPLLGNSRGHFYEENFMCLLNVKTMLPYSITLGCLVLAPSVLTICYTYCHIFTAAKSATKEDLSRHHSDHVSTFIITFSFIVLWMPWGILRLMENIASRSLAGPVIRFWFLFLGELHASITPLTLLSTCHRCHVGLKMMCSFCFKSPSSVPV